jgi:serine/threonine protein kinase/Leucine-rich repeat (LRR) protein
MPEPISKAEIADYLAERLSPEQVRAFEDRLRQDPAARELVKTMRDQTLDGGAPDEHAATVDEADPVAREMAAAELADQATLDETDPVARELAGDGDFEATLATPPGLNMQFDDGDRSASAASDTAADSSHEMNTLDDFSGALSEEAAHAEKTARDARAAADGTRGGSHLQSPGTMHEASNADIANVGGFVSAAVAAGLATEAEMQQHLAGCRAAGSAGEGDPPGEPSLDEFCEWLPANTAFTPYQIEVLRKGQTRGLVLGNYTIQKKLGEGGMGMVFQARHRRMKRVVALKVLPPHLTKSKDAIGRFHREVEAAAKLTHVNICAAYDADEADGIHFLVMENVNGPDLSSYVKQVGPVPIPVATQLIAQAARGLAHAHDCGVVHRDIKPSNLLVDKTGLLKILDMGLAQIAAGEDDSQAETAELTQSGRVMGTVDYMAPEQALDAKRVDHRADIYSLGCTLWYLLAGRSMSPDATLTKKLLWHQSAPIPSLKEANADVPDALDAVFQRMVAKLPDDRQDSMRQVGEELAGCLGEMSAAEFILPETGITLQTGSPSTDRSLESPLTMIDRRERTATDLAPAAAVTAKSSGGNAKWLIVGVVALLLLGGGIVVLQQAGVFGGAGQQTADGGNSGGSSQPGDGGGPANVPGDGPAGSGGNSGGPAVPLPEPQKKPHEDVLTWVFAQGGTARIVPAGGAAPLTVAAVGELPDETYALKSIDLSQSSVTDRDLAQLAAADGITELSLAQTRVSDAGLAALRPLTNLAVLDLTQTRITNDASSALAPLRELRELSLSETAITDQGVVKLLTTAPQLTSLNLSGTRVSDVGFEQVSGLTKLKFLGAEGTFLSDERYDALVETRPGLDIAWDGRDIERALAKQIFAWGGKVGIETRGGEVAMGLTEATQLPRERFSVTTVDLAGASDVTDADVAKLIALGKVRELDLGGTGVTAAGLKKLVGLASLQKIDLGSLPLPKPAVDQLARALPDTEIQIDPKPDQRLAAQVLEIGGKVGVRTSDGQTAEVTAPGGLPRSDFFLRSVTVEGIAAADDALLAELAGCTQLDAVYAAGSGATDAGVTALAAAGSLRELSIGGAAITSAALRPLSKLSGLQTLHLTGSSVDGDGLKALLPLDNLAWLTLDKTRIADADLVHLKGFPKLTRLSVADLPLTDAALPHLEKLNGLSELVVEGTKLTDAGVLELEDALADTAVRHDPLDAQRQAARWAVMQGGSVKLESGVIGKVEDLPRGACKIVSLDFEENESLDIPQLLRVLPLCRTLESINLTGTGATDDVVEVLAKLPNVKSVKLGKTAMSDASALAVAQFPALQSLDISGSRCGDAVLEAAAKVPSLRYVLAGYTRAGDRGVAGLAALPNLSALDLSYCASVTDRCAPALAKMKSLQYLLLRNTGVGDEAAKQLATLEKLQTVDLGGTSVGDAGVTALAAMPALATLSLNRTEITDSALTALAKSKTLQSLDLGQNRKLSKNAVDTLEKALPGARIAKPVVREDRTNRGSGGAIEGEVGGGLR